jgi:UDP-glucose 4-epimerase
MRDRGPPGDEDMRTFVIGGAGFVGSHLVDLLVDRGPVTVFDNLSVGKREFIHEHLASGRARLVEGDALDLPALQAAMAGHDVVFHLAANPEARWGLERTRLDLEQGTIATYNALEAARLCQVKKFVFSSSGTVYGNIGETPCGEMDLGHLPISLYGASKLAGESLIAAYVECFGISGYVCRFGNVVGKRGTHGAILDFCKKLKSHPEYLDVLGDGRQAKPYLHVTDCAAGILFVLDHARDRLNVYNLAPADVTSVRRIAELCVAASPHKEARIEYSGGAQGWPGDVPKSVLRPDKLKALGFVVRFSSDDAVGQAVVEVAREVFGASARAGA